MKLLGIFSAVAFGLAVVTGAWLAVLFWQEHIKKRNAADDADELAATDYLTAIKEPQHELQMTKVLVGPQPEEVEITAVIPPVTDVSNEPAPKPTPVRSEQITLPMLPSGAAWTSDEVVSAWIDDMRKQMEEFDLRLRAQLELV